MRHRLTAFVLTTAALLATTSAVESAFTAKASAGRSSFDAAPVFAPRNTTPPSITGTPRQGETLTASPGAWARGTTSIAYTWLRCTTADACTPVGTGATRELTGSDVDNRLRVTVTVTNAGGSTTATSDATAAVVVMASPEPTSLPVISGSPTVGSTLTATEGTWTGDRLTFARRWQRCFGDDCTFIPGETGADYELTGDDAGARIHHIVTATNQRSSHGAQQATPPIERATFTQILCANPDTGEGVGADGAWPGGISLGGTLPDRGNTEAAVRCARGGSVTGIPLSTGGTFTTSTPDDRLVLQYRMLPDLEFAGATLYRHATMSGHWSWGVQMAPVTSLFVGPHTEVCSWGHGCSARGSATDRFGTQNRVGVWAGPLDGFNVILSCDIPDASRRCDADGSQVFRLFGGTARLRDTSTPKVTDGPSGTLVTDQSPGGTKTLALGATDAGSGLYRVRITIDGAAVATRVLQGSAECVDRNPANGDPYEFAVRRPCALSASLVQQYDTSAWPRSGRLRVYLEDAGRNSTVLVNRRVG